MAAVLVLLLMFWWLQPRRVIVDLDGFDPAQFVMFPSPPYAGQPVQVDLIQSSALEWNGIHLHPRALFALDARVLGRRSYRFGRESEVSTVDLALGWERMADPEILSQFSFSQSGRYYFWRSRDLPIPRAEVVRSSANMHMIAADAAVERELRSLRPGDRVRFEGALVDVHWPDGASWKTSLTRNDSGAGACEIVWVQTLERL